MNALARAVVEALADPDAKRAVVRELAPELREFLTEHTPRPAEDRWLTTRQAAEHIGITVNALHKLTAARSIPFEQEGPRCKIWFRRSALNAWREGVKTST
jgi:hypothetical protein